MYTYIHLLCKNLNISGSLRTGIADSSGGYNINTIIPNEGFYRAQVTATDYLGNISIVSLTQFTITIPAPTPVPETPVQQTSSSTQGGGGNRINTSIINNITTEKVHFVASELQRSSNNYCAYEEATPIESFQDITTSIYYKDIKTLVRKCIIHGLEDTFTTFGPQQTIKKGEVVKIISKWYKVSGTQHNNQKNRWNGYLSNMENVQELSGLENTRNNHTMDEIATRKDIAKIVKNINSDSDISIIKTFKSKRVSRENFAHFITHQ